MRWRKRPEDLFHFLVIDILTGVVVALRFLVLLDAVVRFEIAALLLLLVAKLLRSRSRPEKQSTDLIDHIRYKKYSEEEFENHKHYALNR